MARLNLTIPDPLYERLERLRDRVNVSKVCAVALKKELDMIEGTSIISSDAKVQRMIQRFLQTREIKERWYLRGRQDGEAWAIERASLEELRMMGEEWDEESIQGCVELRELRIDSNQYPSFNAIDLLQRWIHVDRTDAEHDSQIVELEQGWDWRAYLQGWYHGARDLWNAAKPALQ